MCPVSSDRVLLLSLVTDDCLSRVSGSGVPPPHQHWLGQLDRPRSCLQPAPGRQRRLGQTTTHAASPATVPCIVADLSRLALALQPGVRTHHSVVTRRPQSPEFYF